MRRLMRWVSLLMIVCMVLLTLARAAGQLFDRMVWVPAGCFMMGSDPAQDTHAQHQEQPQHQVCLQGFWLDKYEVTNGMYQRFVERGGYRRREYWSAAGWQWVQREQIDGPIGYADLAHEWQPRVGISWYEADAYARWYGCRLPTEAEWEYAARGHQAPIYPWGNIWDTRRLNAAYTIKRATTTGHYAGGKSWVGAYDLAGNVWEWVADWYDAAYYRQAIKTDPPGPTTGIRRVVRGGAWNSSVELVRTAARYGSSPIERGFDLGFRVVCTAHRN
ncbi:MAG: SUMF1/EgtB/PvdO family nonheme iron enzyme [Anaerolineae bacterium]|nr:SUMF1/EgtB/PvdO family nonheme iron enzyme [Anaerolineae bacterium]